MHKLFLALSLIYLSVKAAYFSYVIDDIDENISLTSQNSYSELGSYTSLTRTPSLRETEFHH